MKKSFSLKIAAAIVFVLSILVVLLFCWRHCWFQKSHEGNSTFLVLSTGDCNGVDSIIGIRTAQAIGMDSNQIVYPIESMDNGEYFNLKYPFQSENRVYYTTTDIATGEECIISKSNTAPEWNVDSTYYRKQTEWEIIQKKTGKITYKKVIDNLIYYLLAADTPEIRCYDMTAQTDQLLISDVHPAASFDVREDGAVLYVNETSSIIFRDMDGTEQEMGQGTTACFWEDSKILLVDSSGVSVLSLTDGKSKKVCSVTGTAIVLSPSKTYFALYDETDYKNLKYAYINIVDIATGRINTITSIPDCIYGMAWFNDYYPIN